MTYLDHELGPDGPTRAPAEPVTTQRTPAPLMDLQRLAGNAAVTQAIKSGRFDPDLPVQRIEADEEIEDIEAEAEQDEEVAEEETAENAAEEEEMEEETEEG